MEILFTVISPVSSKSIVSEDSILFKISLVLCFCAAVSISKDFKIFSLLVFSFFSTVEGSGKVLFLCSRVRDFAFCSTSGSLKTCSVECFC